MQQFYIAREGAAFGPLSVDETNRLVLEGTLDRSTLVWDGNRNDWIDASAHPIIARIFERHLAGDDASEANLITRQVSVGGASSDVTRDAGEEKQLRAEIERLEARKSELDETVAAAHTRMTELDEAIRQTTETSEELDRRYAAEEMRAGQLSETIVQAEKRLAERRAELAAIEEAGNRRGAEEEARVRQLEEKIAEEETRLAACRSDLIAAEEQLAARRSETNQLAAEREAGEKRLLAMRDEAARFDRMAAEARASREEADKNLRRLRADAAITESAVGEVKRELGELTRDRDRMRDEATALEIRRSAYDAEIALVNERLAAIREETAALEEKRLEAEALLGREVAAAFDEIRKAVGDLGQLTSVWSEFKSADEEHRREGLRLIDEMTERIRGREKDLGVLFEQVGEKSRIEGERALAEAALAEARARVLEVKEELKSLTVLCWEELQSMESARDQRARIDEEIESQRAESAAMAARQEELIDEVSSLVGRRSSLEMECNALDEALRILNRERERHEVEQSDLRARHDRLVETNRLLEEEIAASRVELARRHHEISESEIRAAAVTASNEERQREVAEAGNRLAAMRDETRRDAAAAEDRLAAMREQARRDAIAAEEQLAERREEARRDMAAAEERLAERREVARLFGQEQEQVQRMAAEARREVEEEIEGAIRTLSDLRVRHNSTEAALELLESRRSSTSTELLRLEEETRLVEAKRAVAEAALIEAESRLNDVDSRLTDRGIMLGRLREEEGERAGRLDRLAADIDRLETERASRAEELLGLNERTALLDAEMVALEKERATRGRADLKDLRDLLRMRELKEREHLEKLLGEARAEFKQLQEDWVNEERGGNTNEDLRRIRGEVEEKRRELSKAERQLAAMRAGLSKLREENGRGLLRRAQSFEVQQLEELRRRIAESKNETEALEQAWAGEMKSSELVDRQWFEIRSAIEK